MRSQHWLKCKLVAECRGTCSLQCKHPGDMDGQSDYIIPFPMEQSGQLLCLRKEFTDPLILCLPCSVSGYTHSVASASYYLPSYLGVCWMIVPFSPLVTSLQAIPSSVAGDSSQLPVREENGEVILPFFWLDAYEDPLNQPGTVFLFGKVKLPNAKLYSRFVYSGTPHCGHP